jgi:hypothetical protein
MLSILHNTTVVSGSKHAMVSLRTKRRTALMSLMALVELTTALDIGKHITCSEVHAYNWLMLAPPFSMHPAL